MTDSLREALLRVHARLLDLERHLDQAAEGKDLNQLGRAWVRSAQVERDLRGMVPPDVLGVAKVDEDAGSLEVRRAGTVLYMVIEDFRDGRPEPVYARFRERGRMAPEGLLYVTSWATTDGTRCFQVMECADRALLDRWMAAWADLVDFTVIPVTTSAEAAERFTPPGMAQQLDHR